MIEIEKSPNKYKKYEYIIAQILSDIGTLRAKGDLPESCDETLNTIQNFTLLLANATRMNKITDDYIISNYLTRVKGIYETISFNYRYAALPHHPEESAEIYISSVKATRLFNQLYEKYFKNIDFDLAKDMLRKIMTSAYTGNLNTEQLDILHSYIERLFTSDSMGLIIGSSTLTSIVIYLNLLELIIYIEENNMTDVSDSSTVYVAAKETSTAIFEDIFDIIFKNINKQIDRELESLRKINNYKAGSINDKIGEQKSAEITIDTNQIYELIQVADLIKALLNLQSVISDLYIGATTDSGIYSDLPPLKLLLTILHSINLMILEINSENQMSDPINRIPNIIKNIDEFLKMKTKKISIAN